MRSAKVFVTSDTHFGHKRITEFEPVFRAFKSVEEHDRALVENWNSVVHPQDTVWHLGDVFFGKNGWRPLEQLNGLKKLVLGNHDHYPLEIYQRFFSKIYGAATYNNCILSHVPVHPRQLEFRYKSNLHGHLHSNIVYHEGYEGDHLYRDGRYINVCLEHWNLRPVPLREVLNR